MAAKAKYVPPPVSEAPRRPRDTADARVILPVPGARNLLITSALPYVNNVPHLGNIIGCVLSADVFARYARARSWNALYVCGTDEYGTATETKAAEEGLSPRAVCDKYHVLHKAIYSWFDISFDHFGRTSCPDPWTQPEWPQTQICQEIFLANVARGNVHEAAVDQVYCLSCCKFLADRFIEGECPLCHYEDARGDQCDKCGRLLSATDLLKPTCKLGKSLSALHGAPAHAVEVRSSKHLFLDLPKLQPQLEEWVSSASVTGAWTDNAVQITRAWLRDGLKPRCITRDLKWGTPVPHAGFEDKVFYVWFDAPIGYCSITADYARDGAWRQWWGAPPAGADVSLYQFMGKDNIPFHTVIFPASLLGTGEPWTLLHHVSTTEYLNYETGKFSKSRGVGVFGDAARDTGIPSEVWRYYLLAVRPEASDAVFSWSEFADRTNNELLKNVGNLVNRALSFTHATFGGHVPRVPTDTELAAEAVTAPASSTGEGGASHESVLRTSVDALLVDYHAAMGTVKLRAGLKIAMLISSAGNLYMQDTKPWELKVAAPIRCALVVNTIASLVRVLASVLEPFMPGFADKVAYQLDLPLLSIPDTFTPGGAIIPCGATPAGHPINKPSPLFSAITDEQVEAFRAQFRGSEDVGAAAATAAAAAGGVGAAAAAGADAAAGGKAGAKGGKGGSKGGAAGAAAAPVGAGTPLSELEFSVGEIVEVWPHPDSEKLYCERISFGPGEPLREVASGLQGHFTLEQMKGARVIVVKNLKARKLAGFLSNGMVLCASNAEGLTEFVTPPAGAVLGERVTFVGHEGPAAEPSRVDKKKLFDAVAPGLALVDGVATWEGVPWMTSAGPCTATTLKSGNIK